MMSLFRLERVVPPLVITFELAYQSCDHRFDWQIRDKVKVHLARKIRTICARDLIGYLLIDLKTTTQDNCRLRTNVLPSEEGFNQAGFQEKNSHVF